MTASLQEVQQRVDALLEVLNIRMTRGQIVLHIDQSRVQVVDTNQRHQVRKKSDDDNNE